VLDGEKPELKPLSIDPEKAKGCTHEGEALDTADPSLVIGKDKGIRNVVVTVEVPGAKAKAPDKPIVFDQKKCAFEPHVLAVPAGSTIEFKNSDSISHNVHAYALKNDGFNQTVPAGGVHTAKFDQPDRVQIACDLHPWMRSYVYVCETPFFAVTDADGNFAISGLPSGEYKLTIWHERLGKGSATVKVAADGKVEPLELKLSDAKKADARRR
jgi:plastocyanin